MRYRQGRIWQISTLEKSFHNLAKPQGRSKKCYPTMKFQYKQPKINNLATAIGETYIGEYEGKRRSGEEQARSRSNWQPKEMAEVRNRTDRICERSSMNRPPLNPTARRSLATPASTTLSSSHCYPSVSDSGRCSVTHPFDYKSTKRESMCLKNSRSVVEIS